MGGAFGLGGVWRLGKADSEIGMMYHSREHACRKGQSKKFPTEQFGMFQADLRESLLHYNMFMTNSSRALFRRGAEMSTPVTIIQIQFISKFRTCLYI